MTPKRSGVMCRAIDNMDEIFFIIIGLKGLRLFLRISELTLELVAFIGGKTPVFD